MYWAAQSTGKIQRANVDGTGVQDLATTGLVQPWGMAFQVAGPAFAAVGAPSSTSSTAASPPLSAEGPAIRDGNLQIHLNAAIGGPFGWLATTLHQLFELLPSPLAGLVGALAA